VGKKNKRRQLGPAKPEVMAAFKAGKTIIVSRPNAIARLLDTAIWLWVLEKDPLAIHLLAMAAYQCLEDMGKKTGKGPKLKAGISDDAFTQAYDFLRHASNNPSAHISLPPSVNSFLIFDAIAAFEGIFDKPTINMRTFRAHFVIFGTTEYKPRDDLRHRVGYWLPEGLTIRDVESLTKVAFFAKLTEMFALQYSEKPPPSHPGKSS
jgi:hypothetical protein